MECSRDDISKDRERPLVPSDDWSTAPYWSEAETKADAGGRRPGYIVVVVISHKLGG